MNAPDFFRFHCTMDNLSNCATCQRDFIIPLNAVEGFFRTSDSRVKLSVASSHFCVDPQCLTEGEGAHAHNRFIKTSMLWDDLVSLLDGRVGDVGDTTFEET